MCHHSFQQAQGQLWLGSHLRLCHRKFRSTEGLGAELDVGAEQAWQAQHPKSNGGGEREKRDLASRMMLPSSTQHTQCLSLPQGRLWWSIFDFCIHPPTVTGMDFKSCSI